jgi:hypothetical protein
MAMKKNLQKKIFIAITTATAIKTGTYKNFQKNPVFPLSVQEGHTRWVIQSRPIKLE